MFTKERSAKKKNPQSETANPKEANKVSPNPETPSSKAAVEPTKKKKRQLTRIEVHCNAGFPNNLYVRGEGVDLNWDRGLPLKNVSDELWIWETELPFDSCEFKILLNDRQFEVGENHTLRYGETVHCNPLF